MDVSDWQQRARSAIDVGRCPRSRCRGRAPRSPAALAIGLLVLLALYSTYYQVNADEVGVVQRFGSYVRTTDPGPAPEVPVHRDR